MDDTNREFQEALRRGDAAGCAAAYPEDGLLMPPGAPMVMGRPNIAAFWQAAIDLGWRDVTFPWAEREELGDTVIQVGTYVADSRPPEGAPNQEIGKSVVIWKRQADGAWKYAIDIWSSDAPPPG